MENNLPADKLILFWLLNNISSFLITVNFGSKKIGVFTVYNLKSLCCICISCRLQWEFCELISFVNPNTYECHFASMWIMQPVKSHPNGIFKCRGMNVSKFWIQHFFMSKRSLLYLQVTTKVTIRIHCHIIGVKKPPTVSYHGQEFLSGVS